MGMAGTKRLRNGLLFTSQQWTSLVVYEMLTARDGCRVLTHSHIPTHTHIYIYMYIHIYMYTHLYTCNIYIYTHTIHDMTVHDMTLHYKYTAPHCIKLH